MSSDSLTNRYHSWAPYLQSLLRIMAAAIFIQSGTMKLFAFPAPMPPEAGKFVLLSQMGLGGVLEFLGGMLLIFGLFTRPVAFILSGMMAVAYFQFHAPNGFWPIVNHGDEAILFCFVWLFFSAAGGGPLSLDALLLRRRAAAAEAK